MAKRSRKLNARERYDIENGTRRAIAWLTYEAEWEWFNKRHSRAILERAIEHSKSAKDLSYQLGISSSAITQIKRGLSKMKPERYLKIIKVVYPEYAKIIEAELYDIERLHD